MRWAAAFAGIAFAPIALAMLWLAFAVGASWSGWAYTLAALLLAAGLGTAPMKVRRRKRWIARGGLVLLLFTTATRACTGGRGRELEMTTTGPSGGARVLGRLVEEGDMAGAGARILVAAGQLHDPDAPDVPDAMRAAYKKMRAANGDAPSPVLPTYAGLESPEDADVLVIDTGDRAHEVAPKGALVFLHGMGGNFALPCWQIAQAAREADLVTYCPSVGPRGDWWSGAGERTVHNTVEMARKRGLTRVYLAGLSNGGLGACHLAARMRGVFRGVIAISGAAPQVAAPGVPVLVLQGARDAMAPAAAAKAYAHKAGGRYVELDGGHFAFMLHEEEANRTIAGWLKSVADRAVR